MKDNEWRMYTRGFNPEIRSREVSTTLKEKYQSGKHRKFGVKYLVCITLQGTIVRVVGPFAGSTHDFRCMKTEQMNGCPLTTQYANDQWIADGGYQGVNADHVATPVRRNPGQELTPQQEVFNNIIQRYRARVEHCE